MRDDDLRRRYYGTGALLVLLGPAQMSARRSRKLELGMMGAQPTSMSIIMLVEIIAEMSALYFDG